MDFYNEKLELNVPEHIAIILDGNGRWAKKRLLPVMPDIFKAAGFWKEYVMMRLR